MAKTPTAVPEDKAEAPQEQMLDEFCSRLSASDRRVELIGAFHQQEAKAGRIKGTESELSARFDAFVKQPA